MQSIGVSAVTAYTAHKEWATRPPDERYASVSALYDAARARRDRTQERAIETSEFRTEAEDDDALVLLEASGRTAALTNWSFEQLATIAGAPPKYLRTLPASIASSAINFGLQRQSREAHQLFTERAAPWTVHAITSPRYARVHTTSWPAGLSTSWATILHGICRSVQGRRIRCRTGSVRRLPGRPRHVPVPRGRQPRSR